MFRLENVYNVKITDYRCLPCAVEILWN